MQVEIQLTRGYIAFVSREDLELVQQFKWRACVREIPGGLKVYAKANLPRCKTKAGKTRRPTVYLHRLIAGAMEETGPKMGGPLIDHIDGNGLNCTRENLRGASISQNQHNKNALGGKSKYKGVFWQPHRRRWYAAIMVNGKRKYGGWFEKEEDAAKAYDTMAIKALGQFARLNFGTAA